MLAAERQTRIVELIREHGSVQVDDLARILDVSPMTIRRDLVKLQKNNQIERCHGGAVAKQEVTYADKQSSRQSEKRRIARVCASLVEEGNAVFLDAGTTTYEIARLIRQVPDIMVVTNDLEIARLLKETDVDLILCGGTVQKSTGSMLGYYATQMLSDFQFDVGFFGAASIDGQFQVLTPTIDKAFLKRETRKRCSRAYLAVDGSKFGKQSMTKINHLGDYTAVITDKVFQPEEEENLGKLDAVIIQAARQKNHS